MKNNCPKCGASLKNSKSKKFKDSDVLSLALLFGDVSIKSNKKAKCDLCGNKIKKK